LSTLIVVTVPEVTVVVLSPLLQLTDFFETFVYFVSVVLEVPGLDTATLFTVTETGVMVQEQVLSFLHDTAIIAINATE